MKNRRRLARHVAFQTLFELEVRPDHDVDESLRARVDAFEDESGETFDRASRQFIARLVRGALDTRDEVDTLIAQAAPAFPIAQMPSTDRVALELAVHELLHENHSGLKVVINEAVQLAKTFGGESSGRFVNGVLGTIAEGLPRATQVRREISSSTAGENTEFQKKLTRR